MQRHTIDYKEILSLFLPAGLLDYFEFTDYSNMGSYYIFCLTEKDEIPEELQNLPLISKGFYPEIVITDFPVRDHTVYLKVKRRRWEDKVTHKTYSRDWKLVADGTRITTEFGSFLKELLGHS
jgi:transposase